MESSISSSRDYNISFFTPRTAFLKDNVRIIVISIVIWAVAVFGFHILLKVIEKPTPEPGYTVYEQVYPKLTAGTATSQDNISIAKVYLGLIAKSIALQKSEPLKEAFTAAVNAAMPLDQQESLKMIADQATTDHSVDVTSIATLLGIEQDAVLKGVIPFALAPMADKTLSVTAPEIPGIMDKYLIHYQSFLTDSKIFGFPFHYFYSAIFLLVLFNLICLVYCYVIDGVMKKHGMEGDDE